MNLFLVFHHNLAFSSIPSKDYAFIIEHVYSRLLEIALRGFPMGLEFTGETLEIINEINPDYIKRLKKAIETEKVELIGSSYSQAIFPLIPSEVNLWNLEFGLETYQRLLGKRPEIAYLNEQCFTDGTIRLVKNQGFKAVLLDWPNARLHHNWPGEWRCAVALHVPSKISILWTDSIMFQKFQRAVWGDIDIGEYLDFLSTHVSCPKKHEIDHAPYLCLYASDAEIFGYRPGSISTAVGASIELDRLSSILKEINRFKMVSFATPSTILKNAKSRSMPKVLQISTASYPIRTKKQQKYNVVRWAVTGRAASKMNTQCFKLYRAIKAMEVKGGCGNGQLSHLKKSLVTLWGSDFRTHTTDEKIDAFRHRMGAAFDHAGLLTSALHNAHPFTPNPKKETFEQNFNVIEEGRRITFDTSHLKLTLFKNKGMSIDQLVFKSISPSPLLGTIYHGFFNDIRLGSDFFSGHLILLTHEGRQYTDISHNANVEFAQTPIGNIIVRNREPFELPGLSVIKELEMSHERLKLTYKMYARDLRPATLRLGIMTFNPRAFDRGTLFLGTLNGGPEREYFLLKGQDVREDEPANHIVSSRHCLGNVDGVLEIGDAKKKLTIKTDLAQLYSVPLIHYEECPDSWGRDSYFFRVYYTICERSDVANVFWKGDMEISFEIGISYQNK